jgi:ribonuclease E
MRQYKIQEVIKRRQIMLVQVVKEERGTKGAALTTYISLAGRFSVLMPNSPRGGGVSRKITSAADRRRLREVIDELGLPDGMSLIVRTAGAQRPKPEIRRDCEYLLRLWDSIRERTLASTAPALIYEEADLIKRSIRDNYARDVEEILVDGEEAYQEAREFMRMLMPQNVRKIQLHREGGLFARHGVEQQLDAMHSPVVQLKSGGYVVINQTEALVAIDVNSGRSTRERHIEDTAFRTNMEAADEIARQLRLRDLAGLIVIDFIDMESSRHDGAVERRLKEALRHDRARIQVGRISHFGLLEMSRHGCARPWPKPPSCPARIAAGPARSAASRAAPCPCCGPSRRRAPSAAPPRSPCTSPARWRCTCSTASATAWRGSSSASACRWCLSPTTRCNRRRCASTGCGWPTRAGTARPDSATVGAAHGLRARARGRRRTTRRRRESGGPRRRRRGGGGGDAPEGRATAGRRRRPAARRSGPSEEGRRRRRRRRRRGSRGDEADSAAAARKAPRRTARPARSPGGSRPRGIRGAGGSRGGRRGGRSRFRRRQADGGAAPDGGSVPRGRGRRARCRAGAGAARRQERRPDPREGATTPTGRRRRRCPPRRAPWSRPPRCRATPGRPRPTPSPATWTTSWRRWRRRRLRRKRRPRRRPWPGAAPAWRRRRPRPRRPNRARRPRPRGGNHPTGAGARRVRPGIRAGRGGRRAGAGGGRGGRRPETAPAAVGAPNALEPAEPAPVVAAPRPVAAAVQEPAPEPVQGPAVQPRSVDELTADAPRRRGWWKR